MRGGWLAPASANPRSPGNSVSAERPSDASWRERNRKFCGPTQPCRKLTKAVRAGRGFERMLEMAVRRKGQSARAHHRIRGSKPARTGHIFLYTGQVTISIY